MVEQENKSLSQLTEVKKRISEGRCPQRLRNWVWTELASRRSISDHTPPAVVMHQFEFDIRLLNVPAHNFSDCTSNATSVSRREQRSHLAVPASALFAGRAVLSTCSSSDSRAMALSAKLPVLLRSASES